MKYRKGFTLLEVLIVVAIIGMLSSVAVSAAILSRNRGIIAGAELFEGRVHGLLGGHLIAEYKFEEGSGTISKDTSGNAHDGTLSGAVFGLGVRGRGLNSTITNGNEFVVPNFADFPFREGSISMWVYPNSFSNPGNTVAQTPLFDTGPAGTHYFWLSLAMQGPNSFVGVYNNANGWFSGLNSKLNTDVFFGRWNHFFLSWTADNRMYLAVNGKTVATYTLSSMPEGSLFATDGLPLTITIGDDHGDGLDPRHINAYIDEVRIYNKAIDF